MPTNPNPVYQQSPLSFSLSSCSQNCYPQFLCYQESQEEKKAMDSARFKVDIKNPRPPPPSLPHPSHPIDGGNDSKKPARSPDENVDCSPVKVVNSTLLVLILFSALLLAFLHVFLYGDASSATDPSRHYHQPVPLAMTARKSISAGDVLNTSCLYSLSHLPGVGDAATEEEILVASVTEAARLAKKAFVKFNGILLREGKWSNKRRSGALNVCVQMMDITVFNLRIVLSHLGTSSSSGHLPPLPASANGSSRFSWHESEVKEYLGAVMADHDTCMNSLEELKVTRKHLNVVKKHMDPIYKMVSNSLCVMKDLVAKEEMRLAGHGGGGGENDALFPATTHATA